MKRYAFVLPRYFAGIAGGAETLCGNLATHLKERGDDVEIWTTCAKDNRTWENVFEPGAEEVNGVVVRRFPVDERDLDAWIPLQLRIAEGLQLTVEEQLDWMKYSVNASELYDHIQCSADEVDAIFFAPYLFGTTFWGSLIAPEKSVLIPCLHDESYAYLDIIGHIFRRTRGSLFNAVPEQHLASRLYGTTPGGEVGMGFVPYNESEFASYDPYFSADQNYFLYAGRKETGKNVHLLIDAFCYAKEQGGLAENTTLVIVGGGDFSDLHRPEAEKRDDIIDLGYVSERDKMRLMKHATACVQPSVNESFSIVLMEAWLMGTPVVVHGHCAVTRHHVIQSGGGLYFTGHAEFAEVARRLVDDQELQKALSVGGEKYVREQYSWDAVLQRFDGVMAGIFEESKADRL